MEPACTTSCLPCTRTRLPACRPPQSVWAQLALDQLINWFQLITWFRPSSPIPSCLRLPLPSSWLCDERKGNLGGLAAVLSAHSGCRPGLCYMAGVCRSSPALGATSSSGYQQTASVPKSCNVKLQITRHTSPSTSPPPASGPDKTRILH